MAARSASTRAPPDHAAHPQRRHRHPRHLVTSPPSQPVADALPWPRSRRSSETSWPLSRLRRRPDRRPTSFAPHLDLAASRPTGTTMARPIRLASMPGEGCPLPRHPLPTPLRRPHQRWTSARPAARHRVGDDAGTHAGCRPAGWPAPAGPDGGWRLGPGGRRSGGGCRVSRSAPQRPQMTSGAQRPVPDRPGQHHLPQP
jgi:hypothetical protein